jgi:aspartate kinase
MHHRHPIHPLTRPGRNIKVLKFGGTSVGAADTLTQVIRRIHEATDEHRVVAVVSAVSGVTDRLVAAANDLAAGILDAAPLLSVLRERHLALAGAVLRPATLPLYAAFLDDRLHTLAASFDEVTPRPLHPAHRDALLAVGERLSAPLVAFALRDAGLNAVPQDATRFIRTDATHGRATVKTHTTARLIRRWHGTLGPSVIPVVTGFLGATPRGATTTLGRGGSDYTAALIAGALHAAVLERWTDVDGLYSDDPRRNTTARRLANLHMEQAHAWNVADRLGMHRQTFVPLLAATVPLHVRSTTNPGAGTLILPEEPEHAAA